MNVDFSLPHTTSQDNSMISPFLFFLSPGFDFGFFLHFKQYDNIVMES